MNKFHLLKIIKKLLDISIYRQFLLIFFLLFTNTSIAKVYTVKNIQIIEPFNMNFKKNIVIEKAFLSAFELLVSKIVSSDNLIKAKTNNLNLIKPMIDSFLINNEKFKDNFYSAEFEVFFNKKKILRYLKNLNITSSSPKDKKILFIPILINVNNDQILLYNENKFYLNWNRVQNLSFLLNYILPNEDLDDYNMIKTNITNIENYDFKEIASKYNKDDFIVSIFFLDKENIQVLSKISLNNKLNIIRSNFINTNFKNDKSIDNIINNLKVEYENVWKKENEINTAIKLPITLSINSKKLDLIKRFERKLLESDLVYDFKIDSFNSDKTIYKVIYNGSPDKFLNDFKYDYFKIDISENIWTIK